MKFGKKAFVALCAAVFLGASLGSCVVLVPAHGQRSYRKAPAPKKPGTRGVVSGKKKTTLKQKAARELE